jgi:predicted P-loop ATPase
MTLGEGGARRKTALVKASELSLGKVSGSLMPSGKANPCPICGRQKDGDCRISAELVLCHHGSSHHPPEGLNPGDTHHGGDGQQWAYTKDTSDGRAATFVIHKPLQAVAAPPRRLELAQLPEAKPKPPSHLPNGQRLKYSDTQTVVVVVDGGSKKHIPHHINASGKEVKGAGPDIWPLWRQADAIEYGTGKWIIETEGEKCAAWPRAAGLVAVSQPGHDTKEDSITGRYKALRAAGVAGVAYLGDNDKTGAEKGDRCQKAAAAAGLPFLLLQAAEVWPGVCAGGSIDDAPGSAQERAQVLQQAIQKASTSKTAKTVKATPAAPGKVTTTTAAADYSRPVRLETHQVLELLPKRIGELRLNVRSGEVVANHTDGPITLSGNDIGRLYLQLSSQAEKWPKDTTADAVALLAGKSPFDPVADNLNSNTAAPLPMAQWQRLDQHLLGINDPIAAAFLPRYLISAVARVFSPGCYVRQTPVLIGKQERGKSELGRILFGADHWVEGIGELGKDDLMKAHTAWGVELAELDGVTRRADQERLKAFLTEKTDTYRKPYDRAPEAHHRRFVFWGSSNGAPLRDTTGSTRFVCIPIPDRLLPLDWARENRSAIWSRAVEQYRAGIDWIHTDEPMRAAIAERNSNFQEIDPWAGEIAAYLEQQQRLGQLPVQVTRVLDQMEVTKDRQNNAAAKRVTAIAEQLGWVHGRRRKPYETNPSTGLWPDAVHTVHPVCTPRGARGNASDSNTSDEAVHTVHPYSPTLSKAVREQEPQQQPAAAPAPTPDTFGALGVHGVHTAENACASVDLRSPEGCTEGCTKGCTEPDWHKKARLLRSADPAMAYATLALMLQTELGVNVNGRMVRQVLEQAA